MSILPYFKLLSYRFFRFTESLADTPHGLGMSPQVLRDCLSQTVLLLGSAPVGPTTTKRLMKYANRLPTVSATSATNPEDVIADSIANLINLLTDLPLTLTLTIDEVCE